MNISLTTIYRQISQPFYVRKERKLNERIKAIESVFENNSIVSQPAQKPEKLTFPLVYKKFYRLREMFSSTTTALLCIHGILQGISTEEECAAILDSIDPKPITTNLANITRIAKTYKIGASLIHKQMSGPDRKILLELILATLEYHPSSEFSPCNLYNYVKITSENGTLDPSLIRKIEIFTEFLVRHHKHFSYPPPQYNNLSTDDQILHQVLISSIDLLLKGANSHKDKLTTLSFIYTENTLKLSQIASKLITREMSIDEQIVLLILIQRILKSNPEAFSDAISPLDPIYHYLVSQIEQSFTNYSFLQDLPLLRYIDSLVQNRGIIQQDFKIFLSQQTKKNHIFSTLYQLNDKPNQTSRPRLFSILENLQSKGIPFESISDVCSLFKYLAEETSYCLVIATLEDLIHKISAKKLIVSCHITSSLLTKFVTPEQITTLLSIIALCQNSDEDSVNTIQIYDQIGRTLVTYSEKPEAFLVFVATVELLLTSKELNRPLENDPATEKHNLINYLIGIKQKYSHNNENLNKQLFATFGALGIHLNIPSFVFVYSQVKNESLQRQKRFLKALSFIIQWSNPISAINDSTLHKISVLAAELYRHKITEEEKKKLVTLFKTHGDTFSFNIDNLIALDNDPTISPIKFIDKMINTLTLIGDELTKEISIEELLQKIEKVLEHKRIHRKTSKLGSGKFGKVLKIYDCVDRKFYAAKVPNSSKMNDIIKKESDFIDEMNGQDPSCRYPIIRKIGQKILDIEGQRTPVLLLELHGNNLHTFIKSSISPFSLKEIKHIASQLIDALQFLENVKIIHTDIKPDNILLKENRVTEIVLTDFSNAVRSPHTAKNPLGSMQALYYRSPECALRTGKYTTAIDMWSIGSILIEVLKKQHPFETQQTTDLRRLHQEYLGPYPQKLLDERHCVSPVPSIPQLSEKSITNVVREALNTRGKSDSSLLENYHFIDFLEKTLALNPDERMTPREAFEHPFLAQKKDSMNLSAN